MDKHIDGEITLGGPPVLKESHTATNANIRSITCAEDFKNPELWPLPPGKYTVTCYDGDIKIGGSVFTVDPRTPDLITDTASGTDKQENVAVFVSGVLTNKTLTVLDKLSGRQEEYGINLTRYVLTQIEAYESAQLRLALD